MWDALPYICNMFQMGKTIISEEIIEKDFVCNLSACKGACCVDGDAGAPLEKEEIDILKRLSSGIMVVGGLRDVIGHIS